MKTKTQKRKEAEARQELYDMMSKQAKIAYCKARRGNSAKELKRLEAKHESHA